MFLRVCAAMLCVLVGVGCWRAQRPTTAERDLWERENPIQALPRPPLGINVDFASLPDPPTPDRVRLGRWLFFDTRLSRDNTLSCGSCHQPDTAFARPSPIARAPDR